MFAASKTSNVSSSSGINYIEDVFSTYLYTGNGTSINIENGINLSTIGGMVWIKNRTLVSQSHRIGDTIRGGSKYVASDGDASSVTDTQFITAFNTNGFTVGSGSEWNSSDDKYVSWTFREQAKFFDIVTYTGTGANQTIAHNLGSVPGCIFIKRINTTGSWQVYHRSLTNTQYMVLNSTAAVATGATRWNSTTPTSTVFSLGTDATVNASGGTYVAYIFAHDAGGFGLTGTDNVISCGSYTGNGSTTGPMVTLSYEPQLVLVKDASNGSPDWWMFDNMRGVATGGIDMGLRPNTSGTEVTGNNYLSFTSTGFQPTTDTNTLNTSGDNYIYIAIRKGPMKVPTTGTSVYNAVARTGTGAAATISTVGFAPDLLIDADRTRSLSNGNYTWDRLRGNTKLLNTNTADAEGTPTNALTGFDVMNGVTVGSDSNFYINGNATTYINWFFKRAPSFFDVVCYTGNATARTIAHNLKAIPQLIITKNRTTAVRDWYVYSETIGNTKYTYLNKSDSQFTGSLWNNTTPTSTVFSLGTSSEVNQNNNNFVAYLFATCPGVSKVGTYTGTGATQTIDCGFSGGARFVVIKRTSGTGDWYVWDTARGMVSGTDPYLLLNLINAETNTNTVYTTTGGFQIVSTATGINASGSTYIYLAIA